MTFYWIYDLQPWVLGCGMVLFFMVISVAGLALTRRYIYNQFRISEGSNETINGMFAGVGVIYGLLVGLVAVAAWDNYQSAEAVSSKESANIAALYRDVSALSQPTKGELQYHLKCYLSYVIKVAWPAHKRGESPTQGTKILSKFHAVLATYHPRNIEQTTLQAEALTAFNKLIEARRARLDAINTAIPDVFWATMVAGTFVTIFISYFFHVSSRRLHLLVVAVFSGFVGCVLFLIAAVDNPFRGQVSVSSGAYELLYSTLDALDPDLEEDLSELERQLQ